LQEIALLLVDHARPSPPILAKKITNHIVSIIPASTFKASQKKTLKHLNLKALRN